MNIFASSLYPVESAKVLDDIRVNKMIIESAQMLARVLEISGVKIDCLPDIGERHYNHPCALWVQESDYNFSWLLAHAQWLCYRYAQLRGREHSCKQALDICFQLSQRNDLTKLLPHGGLTPFVNCTPYKDMPVHLAYRRLLLHKWETDTIKLTWNGNKYKFGRWSGVQYTLLDKAEIKTDQYVIGNH